MFAQSCKKDQFSSGYYNTPKIISIQSHQWPGLASNTCVHCTYYGLAIKIYKNY